MADLTEKALADVRGMIRDKGEVMAIKPTKMLLWGPSWRTDEEVAQAREIAERAFRGAFGG